MTIERRKERKRVRERGVGMEGSNSCSIPRRRLQQERVLFASEQDPWEAERGLRAVSVEQKETLKGGR